VIGFIDHVSEPGLAMALGPEYINFYNDKEANLQWIMASTERLETMLFPYLAFRHREFSIKKRIRTVRSRTSMGKNRAA